MHEEEDIDVPIGVEVLCCAFSGDGEHFAVGASDGVVRVYDDSRRVRKHFNLFGEGGLDDGICGISDRWPRWQLCFHGPRSHFATTFFKQ